jgi:NodT family efflux transporter outer membrane factor (OMF) lipoprotein
MRLSESQRPVLRRQARCIAVAASALALSQFLTGCLLPTESVPAAIDPPARYTAGPRNVEVALPSAVWWRGFRSKELTDLMEEALTSNFDVAAAIARIVQADANARVAGAALLPIVNLNGSATRSRPSQTTSNSGGGGGGGNGGGNNGPSERTLYSTSLSATYEIDFWGKNRAAQRSAEELAVASRYDREVIELTTVVTVANTYFQILASQDRLRIARENLAAATRVLNLIKQRFDVGTASALDVAQQEILVNQQRAAIPPLEQIVRQNAATLAVLIGRTPETIRVRGGSMGMLRIPRVTPGMPSDLIAQRPDIREAEANLASADANVYAARAAFFPSIQLTGEGGYQTAVLKWLFRPESAFFSVAAGLTQPIFDGARLAGQFDLAKGRQDELLQDYRKAIINGFADVERALIAIQETARRVRLQRDVVVSAKRAFDISETRLREGTIDLVTLLITQQALFQAQDALALDQLDRLTAVISLFQALGGGWQKPGEVSPKKAEVISAPKG